MNIFTTAKLIIIVIIIIAVITMIVSYIFKITEAGNDSPFWATPFTCR